MLACYLLIWEFITIGALMGLTMIDKLKYAHGIYMVMAGFLFASLGLMGQEFKIYWLFKLAGVLVFVLVPLGLLIIIGLFVKMIQNKQL